MARQKFTYTGKPIKYRKTGKKFVVNAKNTRMVLLDYINAFANNRAPNFTLPKNLRYNPQQLKFEKIERPFRSVVRQIQRQTAPRAQLVQRQRQAQARRAGIKMPTAKQIRIQKGELKSKKPIRIKTIGNEGSDSKFSDKRKFTYNINPNLTLKENIRRRISQLRSNNPNTLYSVIVYGAGNNKAFTTLQTMANADTMAQDIAERHEGYINEYEGNADASEYVADPSLRRDITQATNITIQRWIPRENTNTQLIGSGTTDINIIEGEEYFHLNIPNNKNCFYSSLSILNSTCSKRAKKEDFDKLLSVIKSGWKPLKVFIQEKATGLKEKFKKCMKQSFNTSINENYSDKDDLIKHVNYNSNGKWGCKEKGWGKKIVVMDAKYNKIETIEPEKPKDMNEKKHKEYLNQIPVYYMMLYDNHYSALIPKSKLEENGHDLEEWNKALKEVLKDETIDKDTLIRKNTYIYIPNDPDLKLEITERLRNRNKISKEWNKKNPSKIPKPVFNYKQTNSLIEKEYKEKMKLKGQKPYSYELFNKEYDYKIATFDIEATPNYTEGEHKPIFNTNEDDGIKLEGHEHNRKMPFQSYMIGLSWFEYPLIKDEKEEDTYHTYNEKYVDMETLRYTGKRIYRYERFEGMDCIKQFFDYLTKHADKFNEYTLFAHNGACFDIPLLLRENLCINDNWRITQSVELNGGYIGLTIDDGSNKIKFKDSFRHLTGSLDSLCKEMNTPNKKKKELFDADDINLQNWSSPEKLPNLREYLKYDCWSLLDLVDIYSHTLYFSSVPNLEEYEKMENVKLPEGQNPKCSICNHECRGSISNSEKHKGRWFWACGGSCRFGVKQDKPRWCGWCSEEETKHLDSITVKKINNRICRINMTDCFTSSSFAKKLLYKHYLPHANHDKFKISKLCKEKELKIRRGYYGGRTEAFFLGNSKKMGYSKLYYFDATSLYPSEMCKHKLPYGLPEYVYPKEEDNKSWESVYRFIMSNFGFYKVRIKSTEFSKKFKPLIGYKDPKTKRLQFQFYDDWFEVEGLFSEEILIGLKFNLYEFQIIECIKFKADHILKNIAQGLFENKAIAKAKGNAVEAKSNKITVNSVYGLFGFNCNDRDGITIIPKDDDGAYDKIMTPDDHGQTKVSSVATQGNYRFIRRKADVDINDVNVGIASAITSYARCTLWEYLFTTQINGGEVLMVDTDSCISNLDLHTTENNEPLEIKMTSGWAKNKKFTFNRNMVKRFAWDRCGAELGSWKNECEEDIEDYFGKKFCKINKLDKKQLLKEQKTLMKQFVKTNMKEQRKVDKLKRYESFAFDLLIMTGCKQYYLNKKLHDGEYIETKKLKGLRQGGEKNYVYNSKDDMDSGIRGQALGRIHYEKLINNEEIFQNQMQFRNPLANHVDETNPFAVNIINHGKKFKLVYTKGKQVIHEGKGIEVKPWTFPNDYACINGEYVIDYSQPSLETNMNTLITTQN